MMHQIVEHEPGVFIVQRLVERRWFGLIRRKPQWQTYPNPFFWSPEAQMPLRFKTAADAYDFINRTEAAERNLATFKPTVVRYGTSPEDVTHPRVNLSGKRGHAVRRASDRAQYFPSIPLPPPRGNP